MHRAGTSIFSPSGEIRVALASWSNLLVDSAAYHGRMVLLLAIRLLAEMGMLACLGIGGWQLGGSLPVSVLLCVVLPLVVAVVWGRWMAPRAPRRLRDPARLAVEVTVFTAALLVMLRAHPSPALPILGIAVWAAFLVSIPSRGHEPLVMGPGGATGPDPGGDVHP